VSASWAAGAKGQASGHAAQLTAVFDAMETGEAPPVRTEEARATMELIAAIYASAFTGRPVTRGEIAPGSHWYERMQGTGPDWAETTNMAWSRR
jgi:hypothetical protein